MSLFEPPGGWRLFYQVIIKSMKHTHCLVDLQECLLTGVINRRIFFFLNRRRFFFRQEPDEKRGNGAAHSTASEGCDEEMEEVTWKMVAGQGTFITDTVDVTVREVRASCPRVVKSLVCVCCYKVIVLLRRAQT